MKAIVSGFTWIITFFKTIFSFITGAIETIITLFQYLATIAQICTNTILNMPSWLQAYGIISLSVVILYLVIGREAGKNE